MIANPRQPTQGNVEDEQRHIAHIVDDLRREFAKLPSQVVDDQVQQQVRALAGAPVRSFVPTLVRRGARERLQHLVVR